MLFTLVSVALFVAASISGVSAEFAVNSPNVTQCQKVTISWDPTNAPPYNVIAAKADDMCGEPLREIGDFYTTITEWVVDLESGTEFYFSVMDSQDREAWSSKRTVEFSSDKSCLPSSGSPTPGSPGGSSSSSSSSPAPSPTSPDLSPLGAANAGTLGSSAITAHRASLPIVAIGGLAVVVALL